MVRQTPHPELRRRVRHRPIDLADRPTPRFEEVVDVGNNWVMNGELFEGAPGRLELGKRRTSIADYSATQPALRLTGDHRGLHDRTVLRRTTPTPRSGLRAERHRDRRFGTHRECPRPSLGASMGRLRPRSTWPLLAKLDEMNPWNRLDGCAGRRCSGSWNTAAFPRIGVAVEQKRWSGGGRRLRDLRLGLAARQL